MTSSRTRTHYRSGGATCKKRGRTAWSGGTTRHASATPSARIRGSSSFSRRTLLWAVEVVLAKRLLESIPVRTLAAARMALGTVVLICWVAISGRGGELLHLTANEWTWAILTGLLLSAYVATWYGALARAQAVDVTAVLVFGAVVTAVVARAADGIAFDASGAILVTIGAALAAVAGLQQRIRSA
jgi:drug/metabolite transporter (DMT)-like permease